ncbi:4811_t:CDS:2 [Funneliformis caledonium]|uniref:4811_t:CDS:1 n=1 Tax=Funneliformis caledonium TaxID=1117310 RepID=A0A9N8Z5J9_9GLOM|nr:4811_t:CDS:2 [Funneliformis caledonium]
MKRTASSSSISSNKKIDKREKLSRFQRVKNENEVLNSTISRHASALGEMDEVSTRDNSSYIFFIPGSNVISSLQEINKMIYKERESLITLYKLEFIESRLFPLVLLNSRLEDCSQREILRLCVELLTRMTKNYSSDKNHKDLPFMKINSAYKELFVLNPSVIRNIRIMLQWHLNLVNRGNEDKKFIHLLLLTCRNLLAIKDSPGSGNLTVNEKLKTHFDLIVQFYNENLIELFTTMASDKDDVLWHTLVFEIFYHILEHNGPEDLFIDSKMEASSKGVKLMEQVKNRQEEIRKKFSKVCPKIWMDTKKGYEKPVDIRQAWEGIPKFGLREKVDNEQRILAEPVNKKKRIALDDPIRKCIKLTSLKIIKSSAFEVLISTIQKEMNAKIDKHDINKHISHYLYLVDYTLKFRIRLVSESSSSLKDEVLLSSVNEISDISHVRPAVTIETFEWMFSLLVKREDNENMLSTIKQVTLNESNRETVLSILKYIYDNENYANRILDLLKDIENLAFKEQEALISVVHSYLEALDHYEGVIQMFNNGLQKKFVSDEIINNYCKVLEGYRKLDDEELKCIVEFFYRIWYKYDLEGMFYKITIMYLFNHILDDLGYRRGLTLAQHELMSFILNISNKLLNELPKKPLLYVELFYPKNSEDCHLLQQGYNFEG